MFLQPRNTSKDDISCSV